MKTIEEMISVMRGYADGKKIEVKNPDGDCWKNITSPSWNWHYYDYRIKAEPKYRPYKNAAEFISASREHGFWMVNKEANGFCCIITAINDFKDYKTDFQTILEDNVWQDDGTPCGVLEEE